MITGALIFFVGFVLGGFLKPLYNPAINFQGYQKTPKWVDMVLKDKQATIIDMAETKDIL